MTADGGGPGTASDLRKDLRKRLRKLGVNAMGTHRSVSLSVIVNECADGTLWHAGTRGALRAQRGPTNVYGRGLWAR